MTRAQYEDFEDFFENAHCGHLIVHTDGSILRCNAQLARWLSYTAKELEGKTFTSLLSVGSRILNETHLAPMLRMRGSYAEMALELLDRQGTRLPVLVSASERRDHAGNPLCFRFTVFKATDRFIYESNLRTAKSEAEDKLSDANETSLLREHFIAVLGHDLRSPLGAITMGTAMLERAKLEPQEQKLIKIMKESSQRISDLIDDVMDFARGRLGGDMNLKIARVDLQPVLMQVIDEIRTAHPGRSIAVDDCPVGSVACDPTRISQILSNLVSNALVHGDDEEPVSVRWFVVGNQFELSVGNSCDPIPEDILKRIFEPFKRKDASEEGKGLGLGLYIAAEIARAHQGSLTVSSTLEETRFTLRMPVTHSPAIPG